MKPHVDRARERFNDSERQREADKQARREQLLGELGQRLDGREFIWWILYITDVLGEAFHTNSLVMANTEGRQAIGRQILAEFIEATPEGYAQMMIERVAEDKRIKEEKLKLNQLTEEEEENAG